MKKTRLFWGLGFLLSAVLIILDAIGIIPTLRGAAGDVSVFSLIIGFLLLVYTFTLLCKGKISVIFLPLFVIFLLFEKNIAILCGLETESIINNWLALLIALLLHVGFALLLPSRKLGVKRKHSHVSIGRENRLNTSTVYVDCEHFTPNTISNKLGECTIHFQNTDQYHGDQTLIVSNNLGVMTINVPSSWTLVEDIKNHLGSIETPTYSATEGPVLYIKGTNHLGSIAIHFV